MNTGWMRALFLCVLVSFLLGWSATAAADYSAEIREASSKLLAGSKGPETARVAVLALVDVLGRMARSEKSLAASARLKIQEASDAFRADPSFEGRGVQALNEAWKAMSGGRAFAFPAEVNDISGATKQARSKIDNCLNALENRSGGRAVRDLLEALLMVLTPMEVR